MKSEEILYRAISEESDPPFPIYMPVAKKCYHPSQSDLQTTASYFNEKYKKFQSQYSMSSRSPYMLKLAISLAEVPREFKDFPIEKILLDVTNEIFMSELEITVFSIYLNRFLWQEGTHLLLVNLYILALASKCYFNEEIDPLAMHINEKIPNFFQYFEVWMKKNEIRLTVSIPELNKTFEGLTKIPHKHVEVEYNFYVDALLQSAPASVYEKPAWLEPTILNVQDIESLPEQPVLTSMDSIFSMIGDYRELPLLTAGLSVVSNGGFDIIWGDK
jgi:hypothetical protein